MSEAQWYRFSPPSHPSQYGYGTQSEAQKYLQFLNQNRDANQWEFEGLGESPELEANTESFLLMDALESVEYIQSTGDLQPYTFRNLKPSCRHHQEFITVEANSLMDALVAAAWSWGWQTPTQCYHDASSDQITLCCKSEPGDGNVIGKLYWSR
jgi:hypothetical protein